VLEIASMIALLLCIPGLPLFWMDSFTARDKLLFGLFLAVVVGVRMVIATEWARADRDGVAFRTLFVIHRVPWREIAEIEHDRIFLFTGRGTYRPQCLVVTLKNPSRLNQTELLIRASLRTGGVQREDFLVRALRLRPEDTTLT
jgi:hypothetical protein